MSQRLFTHPQAVHVLEIVGRIDGSQSDALIQAIDRALNNGCTDLVLDLNSVEYMNSAGLRELVSLHRHVQARGGRLYIANPSERVRKLLELVGLDTLFDVQRASSALARLALKPQIYVYA